MVKTSMGSDKKCRHTQPGDASGASNPPFLWLTHKGLGVINEGFEFLQLMS